MPRRDWCRSAKKNLLYTGAHFHMELPSPLSKYRIPSHHHCSGESNFCYMTSFFVFSAISHFLHLQHALLFFCAASVNFTLKIYLISLPYIKQLKKIILASIICTC